MKMKKFYKFGLAASLALWDSVAVAGAITVALRLRYGFVGDIPHSHRVGLLFYILVGALVVIVSSASFGCYQGGWTRAGTSEILRIMCAGFTTGLVCALISLLSGGFLPLEIIVSACAILLVLMLAGRMFLRFLSAMRSRLNIFSKRKSMRRVLILGAGEAGTYLAKKLRNNSSDNLYPVGYIDDNSKLWGCSFEGIRVLGGRERMKKFVREYGVEEVIIAIPSADKNTIKEIMGQCQECGVPVRRFGSIDNVSDNNFDAVQIHEINLTDLLRRDSVRLNMNIVRSFVAGKTVLVSGGCGSIGSEICRQVLRYDCKMLIILDINENGLFDIDNEFRKAYADRYRTILASVRDKERLADVFDMYHPDVVFHAAAHKHVPMMELNPREAIKNNVFGTYKLAQTAMLHNVEKFILISTDKAVNPTNIMGASKRIAEKVIQMFNGMSDTEFAAVRFGNVLGSNGSVVPFFKKQIAAGGPVTVTHPDMRRYFMTIPEAVQLVLEAGAMAQGGEIFVLDMGEPVRIYDLACDLIRIHGLVPEEDIKIIFTGLRPGEKLFEEISLAAEDTVKTSNNKIFINKPIEWDPIELARDLKALEETVFDPDIGKMFRATKAIVSTFDHSDSVCGQALPPSEPTTQG